MSGHTWQDCARLRFTTPYQRCRLSAEGAWRRPIPGEERSNGQSCRWEQPTARMGEMYAGRPHGRDTTRRAASPGARAGCAPVRCRSCGCAPLAWGVWGAGAPRAAPWRLFCLTTCCFFNRFLPGLDRIAFSQCESTTHVHVYSFISPRTRARAAFSKGVSNPKASNLDVQLLRLRDSSQTTV